MTKLDRKRLKKIIENFKSKRVIVLGDLMLDRYIWGQVARISPEAPVPVVEVKKETLCLGGAGNTGHNLKSLGAFPIFVGVVGNDPEAEWIKNNASDSRGIFTDEKRPTIVKTRIIAHQQQVVRVDQERKSPLPASIEKQMAAFIRQEKCDGIVISDYNKGMVTRSLMREILPFSKKNRIPVFVDPKVENLHLFSPISLLTPNHFEAQKIVHHSCETDAEVEKAGRKILAKISSRYLILKRGEQGLSVFERGKKTFHLPANAKEVYDVTGAGDTVIAAASLALLAGASIQEAAFLANAAAGIVVGKVGTAAPSREELLRALS